MSLHRASFDNTLRHLREGGLACFPTETLWSLSCRADRPESIDRLRALKARPEGVPLAIGIASWGLAARLAEVTPGADALAKRFLPGPISLVLRRTHPGLAHVAPDRDTVSLRIPGPADARELLGATGPLVMTSANLHGRSDPITFDEVRRALSRRATRILAFGEGPVPGTASTIVDCTGDEPRILREGVISRQEVFAAWP